VYFSSTSVVASSPTVDGCAPASASARTIRPFVALLKWLTTERVPARSCSTRTAAVRSFPAHIAA
jgi:hypothetical protein